MNCPLPIECIEVILDHLHATTRARDLFSLLTVNKAFFAASVRRLYADPIETIKSHSKNTPDYPHGAARKLLALVLRCSPDNSPEAQSLRYSLHADIHALPSILTTDYLSFIKTIQYDSARFGPTSALALKYPLSICGEPLPSWAGLHDAFAWAVCAHRLSEIRSLEISWRVLPLYSSRIDDMLSIRSLRILTLDIPREPLYSWTTTQKGDVEFGLRNASWFVNQWSAAYAKLPQESRAQVDIQLLLLGDEGEWWKEEPFKSELKTIYSRMPVSPMRDLSILCTADWARFVLAPESFDLARVRSIIEYSVHNHFRLKTSWPDQGKTKILQQCRSLQKLELICHAPADDAIFKWAVQERSGAAAVAANASSISGATKPLGQGRDGLVPLSELKLVLTDFLPSWQDAVFAFGTTLQSLKIKDCNHSNEVDLCVFQDMPVLRCLTLVCPVIKASVAPFSGCPRLTTIYLGNTGRIFNDQDRFGQWDLAQVQVLTLEGSVCRQFNQATLKKMPMLKALVMIDVVDDMHDRGTFAWDMSCWGPFPRLKSLELSALMTKSFCWSMLEQCPALNYLRLDALKMDPEEVEFPPFSQPLAVYPTLRILALNGYPHSNAGLFDQLPRIAPNLGSLTLHSRTPLSSAQRSELNSKFKLLRYTSYLPDEDYW